MDLSQKLQELFNRVPKVKQHADSVEQTLEELGVTSKEAGGHGGYLVEDDSGKHLPTQENGALSHHLMGAAWAALHEGYRGNKYEGSGKSEAIAKLKRLYAQEGMETPNAAEVKEMTDEEMKKKMDAEHEAGESPDKEKKEEEAVKKETDTEQPKEEVVAKEVTALDAKLVAAINDWQEKHTAYATAKEASDKEVVDLKQIVASGFTSLKELSEQQLATIKELQTANESLNKRLQSLEGDQPRYLTGIMPSQRKDNIIPEAVAKEMAASLNDPKNVPIFGFNQTALEALGSMVKQ